MPIWVKVNNGNWNNDPSANPSTGIGGYPLTGLVNASMVPFGIVDNTNLTFNFGAGSFAYSAPSGFTAGWPNALNTGFTSFDATTIQGDAIFNTGPPHYQFGSDPSIGAAYGFAADARSSGSYYFELQLTESDDFSADSGGGICIPNPNLSDITTGKYSAFDFNGGAIAISDSIVSGAPVNLWISGVNLISDLPALASDNFICFAITLETSSVSQVWLNL